LQGCWSIPGGTVELGETLEDALVREMKEETGLEVEPILLLTVFDRIEREGDRVLAHHVVADYLCRPRSDPARARAGSDALEARWVRPEELSALDLTEKATEVVEQALQLSTGLARPGS